MSSTTVTFDLFSLWLATFLFLIVSRPSQPNKNQNQKNSKQKGQFGRQFVICPFNFVEPFSIKICQNYSKWEQFGHILIISYFGKWKQSDSNEPGLKINSFRTIFNQNESKWEQFGHILIISYFCEWKHCEFIELGLKINSFRMIFNQN